MKILYIAPEHVSGTLSLFKREHERRGDECRFITFWHSSYGFPEDICLNLNWMPGSMWIRSIRDAFFLNPSKTPSRINGGQLPYWTPNPLTRALFALRDERNWRTVNAAIEKYNLFDFDILHLDGGADFTRDARFASAFKLRGKGVLSYFHGSDLRARGYIPRVERVTDLRLTPEWDLAVLDDRIQYLYLPFDMQKTATRKYAPEKVYRIGHAARNPLKGTEAIVHACEQLSRTHAVELVLIRNRSHEQALAAKMTCDIFIDQLTNQGGWGYGMSGVEALAMGIPVIANIPEQMRPLIGDHPFIQADTGTLLRVLKECIEDHDRMESIALQSREWVLDRHSVERVGDQLYRYYHLMGWA